MSKKNFRKGLKIFYEQIDQRLEELKSPEEKQQYLEGLVHAFDSMTRYASLADLTPVEHQNYIESAKSWAYSRTHHLGLDPDKKMKRLIETDGKYVARAKVVAVKLQEFFGIPLDPDEELNLRNTLIVAGMERRDREKRIGYEDYGED
ncbi:MAG: hypothetical protein Q8N63_02110 [Nanoarchaeota archaeon]|nr:hypothetical protein [Nanoarchaeota archaeon]